MSTRLAQYIVRLHRQAALAGVVLLAACESTSPAASLGGVWGARVELPTDGDSLVIALGQEGAEVRGLAMQYHTADLRRAPWTHIVEGSLAGRSVELYLASGGVLVLRGTLRGREISGTIGTRDDADAKPITLRLSDPRGGDVAGSYVLASTSGLPPGETPAVRDTIVALPDGRARRNRQERFFSYSTLAVWSRRGDWFVLDQMTDGSFFIPSRDSLRVQPNALVRTRQLYDGSTVVETYARAP